MRTQQDYNLNKLSTPYGSNSNVRTSKFRLPFRLKTNVPQEQGSSNISSPSVSSFFNLKKFGSSKPVTPNINLQRKSVSFSAGARAQAPDSMDWKKKITADHTDVAYRDAVSRLRSILSPRPQSKSASPERKPAYTTSSLSRNLAKSYDSPPAKKDRLTTGLRSIFTKDSGPVAEQPKTTSSLQRSLTLNNSQNYIPSYLQAKPQGQLASQLPFHSDNSMAEDDLFGFIEKQGAYITQLEKETKHCREELGGMLEKVRDVISENEALHEKQKRDLLSSMIQQLDEKTDSYGSGSLEKAKGPSNVIRDSRIAELEAQLSQAKRSLRLAQEEVLENRTGKGNAHAVEVNNVNNGNYAHSEFLQSQIENLTREKDDLVETLSKFKQMVNELRDRESEAAKRVKNSLEIVEQMQMEKAQSDMETRRLKEELDRHQQRVREMIQDHSRKLHDEKLQVEKKYRQELDHLNNEMNQEMDSSTKSRLDLERQKRVEADLRRDIQQKMSTIDDLRQEMQIKITHLQAELSHCLVLKSTAEQELISARLQAEKVERDGKQDSARLQAEINGLRKRLEQTDADLVKSQEVIVKLNGNVSQLHRESSIAKIRLEGRPGSADVQDSDISSVIRTMEEKHSRDMADLEQLINVQNNLLDKLRNECKLVTDKLEETSRQNKKDRAVMEAEKNRLINLNAVSQEKCLDLEQKVQYYSGSHEQLLTRLHRLEDDDKTRSDRVFTFVDLNFREDLMNGLQSCFVSLQKNTPNPELQKVLLDDLTLILSEINEWIQKLDSLNSKESELNLKSDNQSGHSDEIKENSNDVAEKLKEDGEKSDEGVEKSNKDEEKLDENEEKSKDNEEKLNEDGEKLNEDGEKTKDDEEKLNEEGEQSNESPAEKPTEDKTEIEKDISDVKKSETIEKTKEFMEKINTVNNKLFEMNSQLIDWSKRLEDIIERFSNCCPNKVDS